MSGRKWYEWLLTIVFLAMVLVCVYLNLFTDQAGSLANIIVNIGMFILVGIIFISCEVSAFFPANRIIDDLELVTEKIRSDALDTQQFLWDKYRPQGDKIFTNETLKDCYRDFLRETNRIANSGKSYIRCDLEDFLGEDLTDDVMHRNLLNQVPGALTGLGILGTFIGLSLGLQSFATGSTAEITNSIAPLMSGIKVAFHTSIYGMVFSLVFNYVYKRKLEEMDVAIRQFLNAYRNYVLPDAETDGMNLMIDVQKQQIKAINSLAETIAASLADGMTQMMEPQFDRFDKTIEAFAQGAQKNQMDALGVIVNGFIAEMNKSLGNAFSQLSYTIDQTFKLQQDNAGQLKLLLSGTAEQAARYTTWLDDQEKLVRELKTSIDRMPASTAETVRSMQETMIRSDAQFKDMVQKLEDMTKQMPLTYSDSYNKVTDAIVVLREAVERMEDALSDTADRIEEAVRSKEKSSMFGKK